MADPNLTPAIVERASLLAWPGIEVEWDRSWVLRAANGYTKRANSLQCFAPDDGVDVLARLARAKEWFAQRSLPFVVRTTPLESPELTAALDDASWQSIDASHLYAMRLEPFEPDARARVTAITDPAFLDSQQLLRGYDADERARLAALVSAMSVPAAGIIVEQDGRPVASGLMAIADGIVLAGNIITDPAHRRQGLGLATMRTGLAWAHHQGAQYAALNVQADNSSAKQLYASLGYSHQYDYVYRTPGAKND